MVDCVFCKIVKGEIPCDKVYEDKDVLAFLDISPINKGHTLVIPKKHYANIMDMPKPLLHKVIDAVQRVSKALISTPESGIGIAQNNGAAAGQFVFHAHFHVMPRHAGDGHHFDWTNTKYASKEEMEGYRKAMESAIARE